MSLFPELPLPSVGIVAHNQAPLSKDQKTFNTLIGKITERRAKLVEWESAVSMFRQKYASDLLPLQHREFALQIKLAELLDLAHQGPGLTQGEKRKLAAMIIDLAEHVLEWREQDELKALYNKHSRSDFDAKEAAQLEDMKFMLEDVLGMDLGNAADLDSEEDLIKRVEAQLGHHQEQRQAKAAARKKSAREEAREARIEADKKQMSQSIREVYRKLAGALHPDREPDPEERQRKTALMQRANAAYEKNNLLQLLELQLELEHIDQAHLAGIGPERLKHYVKLLKEQLVELDQEIEFVAGMFVTEFGLPPFERHDPKDILPILYKDHTHCEARIRELELQLEKAGDLKLLKSWLKSIRLAPRARRGFGMPI